MSIPLNTLDPAAVPSVCRLLRTKTAFGAYVSPDDNAAPWQAGESTTAVFWCLKTMDTAGPDDDFAHPQECRAGRGCYREDD